MYLATWEDAHRYHLSEVFWCKEVLKAELYVILTVNNVKTITKNFILKQSS